MDAFDEGIRILIEGGMDEHEAYALLEAVIVEAREIVASGGDLDEHIKTIIRRARH